VDDNALLIFEENKMSAFFIIYFHIRFDHGMDCICNLSHLQLAQCILENPPHLALIMQISLQFSFWVAQLEEYYTGTLPHAAGNFGVTEMNYGTATWSILTAFTGREFYDFPIMKATVNLEWLSGKGQPNVELKHVMSLVWLVTNIVLITLSCIRVYKYLMAKEGDNINVFFGAMSKFISPLLLTTFSLWGLTDSIEKSSQAGSLSVGLCFCLITIKLIVYSMARMSYAAIQLDILPLVAVVIYAKTFSIDNAPVFRLLDLFYLARLLFWTHQAIEQLCQRLKVDLFRIPYKKE
jgi:ethanolaminephosphotransferase